MSERALNRFVWILALVAGLLAVLPAVYGYLGAPAGQHYLGYQYNTDDQMVYAAWMRQAMDGRFLFDNRFTTDAQPGLTVHLYFFLLGLVAKVTGISLATTIARFGFSILFVRLVFGLLRRLDWEARVIKLALLLVVFGGGLGFLVWHKFGQVDLLHPPASALIDWATPGLPVDVWQPEGFVFSSMLTNSLFMVSLCLIVAVFRAMIEARESWRPVLGGALAIAVLMNIHSYDVLLIAFVLVAFIAASLVQRQLNAGWVIRATVISAGVIVPALWFVHVLHSDAVFRARAATLTYSPDFRQVLFGYLPLIALGLVGAYRNSESSKVARIVGVALAVVVYAGMFCLAGPTGGEKFFMGDVAFGGVALLQVLAVALLARRNPYWNLILAWALMGTVCIYFPGLFQRKLAMGLSVPWAVLAASGLAPLFERGPSETKTESSGLKPLLSGLVVVLTCATSLLWLVREFIFIRLDVSNTTRHPVYLTDDEAAIVDYLNHAPGRKVVLAIPGANSPVYESTSEQPQAVPDEFESPQLPDLAPIISGLTGAYTYAGHWSETPDYAKRAGVLYHYFLQNPSAHPMSAAERTAFAQSVGANYAVVPVSADGFVTPADLGGAVVVPGKKFSLVKL